jgi:hypothetical protein
MNFSPVKRTSNNSPAKTVKSISGLDGTPLNLKTLDSSPVKSSNVDVVEVMKINDPVFLDEKARELVDNYMQTKEFTMFKEYYLDEKYETIHYNIPKSLSSTFEKVLALFHIDIKRQETTIEDSAIEIGALP